MALGPNGPAAQVLEDEQHLQNHRLECASSCAARATRAGATGWVYSVKEHAGPWPAETQWIADGTAEPNAARRG